VSSPEEEEEEEGEAGVEGAKREDIGLNGD